MSECQAAHDEHMPVGPGLGLSTSPQGKGSTSLALAAQPLHHLLCCLCKSLADLHEGRRWRVVGLLCMPPCCAEPGLSSTALPGRLRTASGTR